MGSSAEELSVDIIQHIQSLLLNKEVHYISKGWLLESVKEATKTSMLSRAWLRAWSTRPFLILDQSFFYHVQNGEERIEKYLNFVECTLERYKKEQSLINTLKFSVSIDNSTRASLVAKLIGKALDNGLLKLHFFVRPCSPVTHPRPRYSLPQALFTAKSLVELRLDMFGWLLGPVDATIKCHSLRKLYLERIYTWDDDCYFEKLIYAFPLIEQLVIKECRGFDGIKLCKLEHLKTVELYNLYANHIVDFQAPNLESLTYDGYKIFYGKQVPCFFQDTNGGPRLKYLSLTRASITDHFIQNFISTCPLLEELHLESCNQLVNLNLLNHSLKKISFRYCIDLTDVKIHSSNLTSFEFFASWFPFTSLSFMCATKENLKSSIEISCYDDLDHSWLFKLREFLWKFGNSDVRLLIRKVIRCDMAYLRGIDSRLRPKVEKLEVYCSYSFGQYKEFFNGLFWCFHPKTLYTRWGPEYGYDDTNKDFIKFLYRKIIKRTNPLSDWQNDLKGASMEYAEGDEDESLPMRWRSVGALQTIKQGQKVRFLLDW